MFLWVLWEGVGVRREEVTGSELELENLSLFTNYTLTVRARTQAANNPTPLSPLILHFRDKDGADL